MGICASSKVSAPAGQEESISREQFILDKSGQIEDYYDIDPKKLGQGTFGVVHRGEHKTTGASRAIKIVSRAQVGNVAEFKQEVSIMKVLDHPNIIRLYETFVDHKNVYLAMELCKGGELFDRVIALGTFSERQAATVLQHVMRAVFYMHQKDIAHRDLKPENFLFSTNAPIEQNVLKIIDFGTARPAGPFSIMSSIVGTRYYVAPQVLQRRYDRKCDIWSCGAIMYTLLSGKPPFSGRTDHEVLHKVRQGKYSLEGTEWSGVSQDAKDLIRMLMNVNPRARYSAQQALSHIWIRQRAPKAAEPRLQGELVENLRNFHEQNRLMKAALQIIAGQLKDDDGRRLMEAFLAMDSTGDGVLTLAELREGLRRADLQDVNADLESAVRGIDVDCSGSIDYTEFLAASLNRSHGISEEDCRSAFSFFDLDGDGRITLAELSQVLDHGKPCKSSKELFGSVDSDGDGSIDFVEFMAMMGATPSLTSAGSSATDIASFSFKSSDVPIVEVCTVATPCTVTAVDDPMPSYFKAGA